MISGIEVSALYGKSMRRTHGYLLVVQFPVPSGVISGKVNLLPGKIRRANFFHIASNTDDVSFIATSVFNLECFEK